MHVSLEIPDLSGLKTFYPEHYLNVAFLGNRVGGFQVASLVEAFVRLTGASIHQYQTGRAHIEAYWNTHHSIALSAILLGSSYFESCLVNVHRAIQHMKKIRNRDDVPDNLKALLPKRLRFIEEDAATRIKGVRDTIQHLDEKVLNGEVPESTFAALIATGPTTPTEDGNELKRIDRLSIGTKELEFSDLAEWLCEMDRCAEGICKYRIAS
jgi:hypothetical protein